MAGAVPSLHILGAVFPFFQHYFPVFGVVASPGDHRFWSMLPQGKFGVPTFDLLCHLVAGSRPSTLHSGFSVVPPGARQARGFGRPGRFFPRRGHRPVFRKGSLRKGCLGKQKHTKRWLEAKKTTKQLVGSRKNHACSPWKPARLLLVHINPHGHHVHPLYNPTALALHPLGTRFWTHPQNHRCANCDPSSHKSMSRISVGKGPSTSSFGTCGR